MLGWRVGALMVVAAACSRSPLAISCPGETSVEGQCLPDLTVLDLDSDGQHDAAVPDAGPTDLSVPLAGDASAPLSSVTYQIDPAHTGGLPGSSLRPPLRRRWSVTLPSTKLSYPLVVGDFVYLAGCTNLECSLYALSTATGQSQWGPIALGTTNYGPAANPAYDAGRVFTMGTSGYLRSFDAVTGKPGWTRRIGQSDFTCAPVAVAGLVYATADGDAYAVDQNTGDVKWHTQYIGGDHATPAWTPSRLVVEGVVRSVSAVDPADGQARWAYPGGCCDASGDVSVVYMEQVWAGGYTGSNPGDNVILDLMTGQTAGTFTASLPPAFENGLGFFLSGKALEGRGLDGSVKWSFSGDGMLVSTPLAVGGVVYIGSWLGAVYGLDEQSGQQLWTDQLAAPVAPSFGSFGLTPIVGLGASDELLVVPAGSVITAYEHSPTDAGP
jgi:outer membrane protein assembly factor BamB